MGILVSARPSRQPPMIPKLAESSADRHSTRSTSRATDVTDAGRPTPDQSLTSQRNQWIDVSGAQSGVTFDIPVPALYTVTGSVTRNNSAPSATYCSSINQGVRPPVDLVLWPENTIDDQAPLTSPKTVEFFSLRLYAVEAKWQIPDDGWSGDTIRS